MTTQPESSTQSFSPQQKKSFHAWHIERAKQLDDAKIIYALYGALDGLSISYSTLKYAFDLLCTNSKQSSADVMHEWMATPGGALVAASEAVVIIGFSLLAHALESSKNSNSNSKNVKFQAFRKYITLLWPYCRDALKGSKNAYKGVRSALQIAGVFTGQDLNVLILPVSLLLGGFSVVNRIWYRSVRQERKKLISAHKKLLKKIQNTNIPASGDEEQLERYKNQLKMLEAQITAQRDQHSIAVLSQVYSGCIDGLYLYMGIMGVANLAPPVFITLSVFSLLFMMAGIAGRIHEENEAQRELKENQLKADLALCGKELEKLFNQLQSDYSEKAKANKSKPISLEYHQNISAQLQDKLDEFAQKRKALHDSLNLSNRQAALAGLKNGLTAYGVICSAMFSIATIYAMCSVAFPPAFVITTVALGVACLIGFTAHALIKNYNHLSQIKRNQENSNEFSDIYKRVKAAVERSDGVEIHDDSKHIINEGLALDVSPQFFFQEWFEVIRSFFSGIGKGQKSIDYTLNVLQEKDEETGHYHDTPIMFALACASSVVFAVALSLRAYTNGFRKKEIADNNKLILTKDNGYEKTNKKDKKPTSCQDSGESAGKKKRPDSPSWFGSFPSFFSPQKKPSPNQNGSDREQPTPNTPKEPRTTPTPPRCVIS